MGITQSSTFYIFFKIIFQGEDFSRLEWGRGAKDTAVDKQRKYAATADNKALRSFCKGCGAFAKVGHKRKVRCKCKRVRSDRNGCRIRCGQNAKGRVETRPSTLNYLLLPLSPEAKRLNRICDLSLCL